MTNATNNTATKWCQHGKEEEHMSGPLVCLPDRYFDQLEPHIQDALREDLGKPTHCICCHRAFSSKVEDAWAFNESPGFGICHRCYTDEPHDIEDCPYTTACRTAKQCRKAKA